MMEDKTVSLKDELAKRGLSSSYLTGAALSLGFWFFVLQDALIEGVGGWTRLAIKILAALLGLLWLASVARAITEALTGTG